MFAQLYQIWGFSTDVHEKPNFMEIHPMKAAQDRHDTGNRSFL